MSAVIVKECLKKNASIGQAPVGSGIFRSLNRIGPGLTMTILGVWHCVVPPPTIVQLHSCHIFLFLISELMEWQNRKLDILIINLYPDRG